MAKSILQSDKECYLCRKPGARRELEQAAQFAFDELHGPGSFAEVFGEEI